MLLHFWNLEKILSSLKHNITFISLIFWKLLILESVITRMPENVCLRTPFWSERFKGSETLLKFSKQHFCANLPLISNKFSCLSCVLVGCETPGPVFKVLTADHIYSCHNREKFAQQVQTQLSSKPWTFSGNFIATLKSTENSEHFGKKINSIPSIFPKLWFPKNAVIWMPESSCFRTPSGNQRVKGSKTLMKFHGSTFVLMFH